METTAQLCVSSKVAAPQLAFFGSVGGKTCVGSTTNHVARRRHVERELIANIRLTNANESLMNYFVEDQFYITERQITMPG